MLRFLSSRELSGQLSIPLAKWKRWSREFLPPDPLGGLQSGVARQFSVNDALVVFLGGHLVAELKVSIPDARRILADLAPWLRDIGLFAGSRRHARFDAAADETITGYSVWIDRDRRTGKNAPGFAYTLRGTISRRVALDGDRTVYSERYVEDHMPDAPGRPPEPLSRRALNLTAIAGFFVTALGLKKRHFPLLTVRQAATAPAPGPAGRCRRPNGAGNRSG
jgi:hypothetical protein